MSRAWRKLNRKVQIDQRRYYLWMIAVLIGIPVNFIFSGWGEDELACTFAHFSSTWFMWVEYKTLSIHPPPHPHHLLSATDTCLRTNADTHTHKVVNYCLWAVSWLGQFTQVYVRVLLVCGWTAVVYLYACTCFGCVYLYLCVWDSSRAISGNDSRESGECHYSDLFTF